MKTTTTAQLNKTNLNEILLECAKPNTALIEHTLCVRVLEKIVIPSCVFIKAETDEARGINTKYVTDNMSDFSGVIKELTHTISSNQNIFPMECSGRRKLYDPINDIEKAVLGFNELGV